MKRGLQALASPAQEPQRPLDAALRRDEPRVYLLPQILRILQMSRSDFFAKRAAGQLPFLEEIRPPIGRRKRYRADLVDRWAAGEWNQPRAFRRVK